jgi:hypothetical protein
MIATVRVFISDLLHRRGIDDRDTYALRSAHALSEVRDWKQPTIKLALGKVRTDLYRRNRSVSREEVLNLVSSAVVKNWSANPVAVAEPQPASAVKVLFVAANPVHVAAYDPVTGAPLVNMPLGLDHEFREIQSKIRGSKYRGLIELISRPAAQPGDLLQAIHEVRPDVVHFSGHGSRADGLYLLDKYGQAKPVSRVAIANLFKLVKDQVRLVVFNACESRPLAVAVTKHIDCAIGTTKTIGDDAAIVFGAAFYRALGFGQSVKRAFEEGIVELQLQGIDEDKTPKLVTRKGANAGAIKLVGHRADD